MIYAYKQKWKTISTFTSIYVNVLNVYTYTNTYNSSYTLCVGQKYFYWLILLLRRYIGVITFIAGAADIGTKSIVLGYQSNWKFSSSEITFCSWGHSWRVVGISTSNILTRPSWIYRGLIYFRKWHISKDLFMCLSRCLSLLARSTHVPTVWWLEGPQ